MAGRQRKYFCTVIFSFPVLYVGLSAEEGEVLADKLRLLDKVFEEEVRKESSCRRAAFYLRLR